MSPNNDKKSNLCNRSFKGQDLSGISFLNADIRGANFTNATLIGANFSHAQAGLATSRRVGLIVGSLILVAIAGLVIGFSSAFPTFIANLLAEKNVLGKESLITVGLLILTSFVFVILRQGLGKALGVLAVATAVVTAIVAFAGTGDKSITAAAVLQAVIIAAIVAGVLVTSLALSIFLSISKIKTLALPVILGLAAAVIGAQEGVKGTPVATLSMSLAMTGIVSTALIAISTYISIRAMNGDKKYGLIWLIAISLSTALGTSFRGANLTNADFTEAILPHTDFRKAVLKRTSWFQSSKLELSRVEDTYLEDLSIRHLVVSKDGHGNIYDYKNLKGLNLHNAKLMGASFIGADFSGANLQDADFTQANLAKAKLYGVNLSRACLTEACIEDWAISTDLVYENISCDAIYMRLTSPENKNPCRKPDDWNETFKEGDFSDFIFPYMDRLRYYTKANEDPRQLGKELKTETIDLYHYDEFNSSSALIALKKLAEENPAAKLEVASLGVIKEEKVHLKIAIKGQGDAAKLAPMYHKYYREISRFSTQEIQQQIELIIKENDSFSRLVSIFTLPRGDSIINIHVGRDISGVLNFGSISGDLSNTINQLPISSES